MFLSIYIPISISIPISKVYYIHPPTNPSSQSSPKIPPLPHTTVWLLFCQLEPRVRTLFAGEIDLKKLWMKGSLAQLRTERNKDDKRAGHIRSDTPGLFPHVDSKNTGFLTHLAVQAWAGHFAHST